MHFYALARFFGEYDESKNSGTRWCFYSLCCVSQLTVIQHSMLVILAAANNRKPRPSLLWRCCIEVHCIATGNVLYTDSR